MTTSKKAAKSPTPNHALQRLVHAARTKDGEILDLTEIAARCQITRYHLWRLLSGNISNPTPATVRSLARGLRCTVTAVEACW